MIKQAAMVVALLMATGFVFAQTTQPSSSTGSGASSASGSTGSSVQSGQTGQSGMSGQSGQLRSEDRRFITEAAVGGLFEVQAGQLASQKAVNPQVKQFGQRMVTDHTQANQRLARLAQSKGVTVPTELDSQHRQHMDRLTKATGAEFDRAYVEMMVRDHQKDISAFERQAQNRSDSEVSSFASQTLPTLREHMQQIRQIATTMGITVPQDTDADRSSTGSGSDATGASGSSGISGSSGATGSSGSTGSSSGASGATGSSRSTGSGMTGSGAGSSGSSTGSTGADTHQQH